MEASEIKFSDKSTKDKPQYSNRNYEATYQYYKNKNSLPVDLRIDPSVAPPVISVEDTGKARPVLSVPKAFDALGREANYYFEVDTDPSFSSSNLWRFPALQQTEFPDDPTSIAGLKFDVFSTTQRGVDGKQNRYRFPFRVTAMRLPAWDKLDFNEMQKHARALAFNLPAERLVKEFYRYVRQNYPWSSDTVERSPLDTFVSGLGECGHVNDLMGALLEMNGIRYRGVAGFSPSARVVYPGGGHSAIEVMNPETSEWSYVDPYLDVLLMDVSAEEIARNKEFERFFVYGIESRFRGFGTSVTLNRLFKYRIYYDKLKRQPTITMSRLFGEEYRYGMTWPLNIAPKFSAEDLFEEKKTIYVRARYIFSGSQQIQYNPEKREPIEGSVIATEWATTSFEVEPRRLVERNVIVKSSAQP
ncbi:transglutaminase-like domain-containing protein [Bosea sp. (in: a-proteobacteria)]|uniref:transglutaminase-like domain-containing protein n=1 Tax=Bosea sp. (in: a-proteobacteria) TaxID=1871050 RepID=UPI0026093D6E|nr:transglutaminase-like domain-containing protein [Bosea sp. (in: a-proteobacteria)]MCO5092217.1 transglutaminase-like domain-containing protein [Bosea sp. (in: a-proteobacteria)]